MAQTALDQPTALNDYSDRQYLSVVEVASYLSITVEEIHALVKKGDIKAHRSASGQYRFALQDIDAATNLVSEADVSVASTTKLQIGSTAQSLFLRNAQDMSILPDETIHLAVTSPPYFNAKMYSLDLEDDLGNVHDLDSWFREIGKVWQEVFRVLQPGRKFFLNIMNLPVRENGSFRSLNLVGKSIDLCESLGFIFKRDIIWHKTNGVRAHFGTYPYPGGILINNMHEHILEFNKPERSGFKKYDHLSQEAKEASKLDKEFWLSIKNSDVWLMKPEKSGGNRSHAAPFPLELPSRLIKAFSYVGETILDPFAGSGTTLLAAASEGRNGVGIEINPFFVSLSIKRLGSVEPKLL